MRNPIVCISVLTQADRIELILCSVGSHSKKAKRLRIRKSEGRREGRKPYGATDEERANIELMKQLKQSGVSRERIASHLNSEGIKPRTPARAGRKRDGTRQPFSGF